MSFKWTKVDQEAWHHVTPLGHKEWELHVILQDWEASKSSDIAEGSYVISETCYMHHANNAP